MHSYLLIVKTEGYIRGLDFGPLGTSVASIDHGGFCLISDIDTISCCYHMRISTQIGNILVYFKN